MASITHFSHEHPLHLLEQKPTEAAEYCYACEVKLIREHEHLVEVYGCEVCENFFLHKYCAQFPMEIVHTLHENHSLFLVLRPLGDRKRGYCNCNPRSPWSRSRSRCRVFGPRFFYYCYSCDFMLATDCSVREKDGIISCNKELIFHHPSHKPHPLMILSRPASLLCDACGVKDEDFSYHCSTCSYWIHKRCAMLPITTTHDIHSHPLTLSFIGLPSHHRNSFEYYCDICGDYISSNFNTFWLYYCDLCRYFVHIRCMAKKKPQIEVDLKGLVIDDLPQLPMSDKSVELIQRFLLENHSLPSIQQNISIFSHRHSLVYSNDKFVEDGNEDISCDACIEPILSPPYYHCAECGYFLHLPCAKLPQQLQHSSHPHLLTLTCKMRFDEVFVCSICDRLCNGFYFRCTTEGCEFSIDIKCAALPKVINHAYHSHPLFQKDIVLFCNGCGSGVCSRNGFGCKNCRFSLHMECALLPKTTKHRHDSNHPLILRFPPHSYHPKPLDCYRCEDEIDPNFWLYHCEECDLSFHVGCANKAGWRFVSVNMKFGQKVQTGSHLHPLKFCYQASVRSSRCHNCKELAHIYDDYDDFSLECETCNFRFCRKCITEIELV